MTVGIERVNDKLILGKHIVLQNYSNPFNSVTTRKLSVPSNEYATCNIFFVLGQEADTLYNNNARNDIFHQGQFNTVEPGT